MVKMTKLKTLTEAQLNKMISETEAELKRRETINAATLEISAILKKYRIKLNNNNRQKL